MSTQHAHPPSTPLESICGLAYLAAIASAIGGVAAVPSTAAAQTPTIVRFQASTTTIDHIQPVGLSWRVEGAVRVDVVDGFRGTTYPELGNENWIEVWPERTATYTLVAYGPQGQVAQSPITIHVTPVSVDYFVASMTEVRGLQPVRLSWSARGARQVDVLDQLRGTTYPNLGNSGSLDVWPERSGTYALQVTGLDGQVQYRSVWIEVYRDDLFPIIHEFNAGPTTVRRSENVNLWWTVERVDHIEIYDGLDRIVYAQSGGSGSVVVQPHRTMNYRLFAYGEGRRPVVRQLTVFVTE